MSVYSFFQLMLQNLSQPQGASAKVCLITPSTSNATDVQILRTEGNATFANFFVTPRSQGYGPRLARRFVNLTKVAVFNSKRRVY